ncbi:transmembrane protein sting [Nomia melanderi]|uniref:transmembrane protein sting n=1 Tax=Nomia melanderi TaxID=2448451 RepID=UPI0013042A91|nr:stimulator of interferon genes protein [Nomia melanderi]
MRDKVRLSVISFVILHVLLIISMQLLKYRNPSVSLTDHLCMIVVLNTALMTANFTVTFIQNLFANYSRNSMKTDVETLFMLNPFTMIFIVYLIIFTIIIVIKHDFFWKIQFNALTCMIYSTISMLFLKVMQYFHSNIFTIDSMEGLDCGTYMALSYYHGYLKLIIPSTGTRHKGIREKIENIEDQHNISIATHKLLILIPASSYIPPDLKEVSNRWMESVVELEEEKRDRAGVKGRSYRNNVYKIYEGGIQSNSSSTYIVAEGATPLLTFFESQKHAHSESVIYKKYSKEIIKKFYQKLKELIDDDPECKDLCELIYYEDYDDTGTKVNVAKVILNRLSQISQLEHA